MGKPLDKGIMTVGDKKIVIDNLLRHSSSAPLIDVKMSDVDFEGDAAHERQYPPGFILPLKSPTLVMKVGEQYIILLGDVDVGAPSFKARLITKHTLKRCELVSAQAVAESERVFQESQDPPRGHWGNGPRYQDRDGHRMNTVFKRDPNNQFAAAARGNKPKT